MSKCKSNKQHANSIQRLKIKRENSLLRNKFDKLMAEKSIFEEAYYTEFFENPGKVSLNPGDVNLNEEEDIEEPKMDQI